MCAYVAVVGLSFGAIAVAAGLPLWLICLMSLTVFAGGSQFMAVGVVAAGGGPVAALVGALLLNARHVPFGLTMGDVLGTRWATRLVGAHLLVDETVAFSLAQQDKSRRLPAFWACGAGMYLTWNLATLAGGLLGQAVGNPDTFGVDAAFPAGILALVLPALREAENRRVAGVGVAAALVTTPFLPAGIPVLLALLGVLAATPWRTKPVAPQTDPEVAR